VPGSEPIPSTLTKRVAIVRRYDDAVHHLRFVLMRAASLPLARSTTDTDWSRLLVPMTYFPLRVTARL
jgi:hypothetical protein